MSRPMGQPLYVSRPTVKSVWQEYRIYADHLEFDTLVFGTLRIPLDDVSAVSERPAGVIFDLLRGDYGLKELLRTLKLDWADLNRIFRQLRLTPEDPAEFVRQVERARAAHQSAR